MQTHPQVGECLRDGPECHELPGGRLLKLLKSQAHIIFLVPIAASGFPEGMPVQPTMHCFPKAQLELYSGLRVILYDRTMHECEDIRLGEIICAIIRVSFAGFHR